MLNQNKVFSFFLLKASVIYVMQHGIPNDSHLNLLILSSLSFSSPAGSAFSFSFSGGVPLGFVVLMQRLGTVFCFWCLET